MTKEEYEKRAEELRLNTKEIIIHWYLDAIQRIKKLEAEVVSTSDMCRIRSEAYKSGYFEGHTDGYKSAAEKAEKK